MNKFSNAIIQIATGYFTQVILYSSKTACQNLADVAPWRKTKVGHELRVDVDRIAALNRREVV
jgi:hypothetical protein